MRRDRILTQLLSATDEVIQMIDQSFLSDPVKERYIHAYRDKIIRMGMTNEMIGKAIDSEHPGVYATTTEPIKLTLLDRKELVGFFDRNDQSDDLAKKK